MPIDVFPVIASVQPERSEDRKYACPQANAIGQTESKKVEMASWLKPQVT